MVKSISRHLLQLAALFVVAAYGCRSGQGFFLSVEMPVSQFVQTQNADPSAGRIYDFPTLQAYNGSGQLIYFSHDAEANAALLRSLPESLEHLSVIPNGPELQVSLRHLPVVNDQARRTLSRSGRPVVVAYTLEDCHACSVQEEALKPTAGQMIAKRGVDVLSVRILR